MGSLKFSFIALSLLLITGGAGAVTDSNSNGEPQVPFNDPYYKKQKFFGDINADAAYRILLTGPRALKSTVKVGVIDHGLVYGNHPDLVGQLLPESDVTSKSKGVGHGHHVLGIMAAKANNGTGIAGVAGVRAKFLYKSIPLTNRTKTGGTVDLSALAGLIRSMGEQGIDVVNLSFGVTVGCANGSCAHPIAANALIHQAMTDTAAQYGTLFVVAAGNNAPMVPEYSNPVEGILVVGAARSRYQRSEYSNFGAGVDLYASDLYIYGFSPTKYMISEQGTSFTTPIVAGAAALIKGYLRQNGTEISAADLARLIIESSSNSNALPWLDFGRAADNAQKIVSEFR